MRPSVHLLLQGEHGHAPDLPPGTTMLIDPLTSSSVLIVGAAITVFDTGTPPYLEKILSRLRDKDIDPRDVQYLIVSHGHQDHWLNAHMYPNAAIITEPNVQLTNGKRCEVFEKTIRHPDWEIVSTNGHTPKHLSLLIYGKWQGEDKTIVLAGDAIREDLVREGYYTSPQANGGELESARWVLEHGEVIIPGHYGVMEAPLIVELRKKLEIKT